MRSSEDGGHPAFSFSVIIPVWNGGQHLATCLRALAASERPPDEIVVVDDGSTDDSAAIARAHGAKVLCLTSGPFGPASARNRGVEESTGNVVIFVDCDVAVHPQTLTQIEEQFRADPEVCAVFGSYDDQPTEPGLVSRYRNLLHHHVHQQSRREASTFWAGCGAIRREVFERANGFDETYRWASIEDIELGVRLKGAGHRLLLCREIQATHGKRWTLRQVIHTDIFRRAVPWTKLLLKSSALPNDLNLRMSNRISSVSALLLPIFLILGMRSWPWLLAAGAAVTILLVCNFALYRLFLRRGGFLFSLGAILLHWLHYIYTSATFLLVILGPARRSERSECNPLPSPNERHRAALES